MFQYVVAALCGISLTGSVYMAGWGGHKSLAEACGDCCDTGAPTVEVSAKVPTGMDMKNTKCLVTGEDLHDKVVVAFEGKVYNICCDGCIDAFKKEPQKYIKAFEADPAKFGVTR